MSSVVSGETVVAALRRNAIDHPSLTAVRTADDAVSLTWLELRGAVDDFAAGLSKAGMGRGETAALMMGNRPEFQVADLAVLTAGGTPFSIYQTYTAEQVAYVVGDAGSKIAIVAAEYVAVVREAQKLVDCLETISCVDGAVDGAADWKDFIEADSGFDGDAAAAAVRPDDLLTIIYTSGTTGPPKGVELTHAGTWPVIEAAMELGRLNPGERVISWLPAAHVAERVGHHYGPIACAGSITCCPDPRQITQFLGQVRPQFFFAVPRIWEKLKAGLEAMVAAQPEEQSAPLRAALDDALTAVQLKQRGEPVPADLEERVAKADAEIFSGLRGMLGLDQARWVGVGAAPTPREVLEFFHALGIEIAEIWGMSETSGFATANPTGAVRIGTVGPPTAGAEVVLAEDGEVLVRGDLVMRGYRNKPEATAEAIDSEGWLHTGDIGSFDEAGYLKIVDRKKEIIINAAGKNMSPANIEAAVKSASPLIGQACVIGDAKPYNTALVVLDPDVAPAWAAQQGLEDTALSALSEHSAVRAELEAAMEIANTKLARVEQIKRFKVLPVDWLAGGDELTPTMKLKRKPISAKYAAEIDELYS